MASNPALIAARLLASKGTPIPLGLPLPTDPINLFSLGSARSAARATVAAMGALRSGLGLGKSAVVLPINPLQTADAVMLTASSEVTSQLTSGAAAAAPSGFWGTLRGITEQLATSCSSAFRFVAQHFLALPLFGKVLVGVVVVAVVCGIVMYFFTRPGDGTVVHEAGNVCPITQEPFVDPVVSVDGHTYERWAIENWFESGHNTSPLTNLPLKSLDLIPNLALRPKVIVA